MSSINNKIHSVAYTGSYAVILLYIILLVHNYTMTVSQGPLLLRYSSMDERGTLTPFTTTVHDGVNDGTRVLPIGSE